MPQKNLSSNKIDTVIDKADEKTLKNKWSDFLNSLELFSNDFMSNSRNQPTVQERQDLQYTFAFISDKSSN